MEPFTHALTALAISRAGVKRLPAFGTAMLVTSALAPDLDYASYFGGPEIFLRFHSAGLHSLAGSALLACALAVGSYAIVGKLDADHLGRDIPSRRGPRLSLRSALAVCSVGVASHVLLDLASGDGVSLLWPFRRQPTHFDLAASFDPWIMGLLIAGLLLPQLFQLVNEEVGARNKNTGGTGAIITLIFLMLYFGARADLHHRAITELLSSDYHGRGPLEAEAFPEAINPFHWRGVVATDSTIEKLDVAFGQGEDFDADRSLTHYKLRNSPVLDAGENTSDAKIFLSYARFPFASVSGLEDGYRFELRDLRFASDDPDPSDIIVRVDFDSALQIKREEFLYPSSVRR